MVGSADTDNRFADELIPFVSRDELEVVECRFRDGHILYNEIQFDRAAGSLCVPLLVEDPKPAARKRLLYVFERRTHYVRRCDLCFDAATEVDIHLSERPHANARIGLAMISYDPSGVVTVSGTHIATIYIRVSRLSGYGVVSGDVISTRTRTRLRLSASRDR